MAESSLSSASEAVSSASQAVLCAKRLVDRAWVTRPHLDGGEVEKTAAPVAARARRHPLSKDDGVGSDDGEEGEWASSTSETPAKLAADDTAECWQQLQAWRETATSASQSGRQAVSDAALCAGSSDAGAYSMPTDAGPPSAEANMAPLREDTIVTAGEVSWVERGVPPLPPRWVGRAPRFEWVPGGFECRKNAPIAHRLLSQQVRPHVGANPGAPRIATARPRVAPSHARLMWPEPI